MNDANSGADMQEAPEQLDQLDRAPTIDLSRLAILGAKAHVAPLGDSMALHINMKVLDVATGVPFYVQHRTMMPNYYYERTDVRMWIRAQLLAALGHELDECLRINGKQVIDPHKEKRTHD